MIKWILVLVMLMISGIAEAIEIEIHPERFSEIKIDPADGESMLCGIEFVAVNPNSQRIKGIEVEEFYARSETRSLVTKRDLGKEAWGWLKYIEIEAYQEFPYIDIVMVFSKATLDKYYEGKDTLEIGMLVKYWDGYKNEYQQRFKWEYRGKKWSGGKVKKDGTKECN